MKCSPPTLWQCSKSAPVFSLEVSQSALVSSLYLKDVVALSSHSLFFPPTIYENADRACVPFSSFIVYGPQQGLFCSVFHHFLPCVFHSLNKSIRRTKSPRRLSFYFPRQHFWVHRLSSSRQLITRGDLLLMLLLVVTGADLRDDRVLDTNFFWRSPVRALRLLKLYDFKNLNF